MDMSSFPPGNVVDLGPTTQGFVSTAETTGPRPAVVLCHERYGLVKHTCDLVQRFASCGYLAIAPDFYSDYDGDVEAVKRGDVTVDVADATVQHHLGASLDWALKNGADPDRLNVVGICLSGSYPLLINAVRDDIAASVILYGGAQTKEWRDPDEKRPIPYEDIVAAITAPVLGVWAEADWVSSVYDVLRLRDALERNRKSYSFRVWRDMPHGWLNDTMPGRYRHRESEQAFLSVLEFLDQVHAGAYPADKVRWDFASDMRPDYDPGVFTRLA
jgi:carboxymethylenebutenolidase